MHSLPPYHHIQNILTLPCIVLQEYYNNMCLNFSCMCVDKNAEVLSTVEGANGTLTYFLQPQYIALCSTVHPIHKKGLMSVCLVLYKRGKMDQNSSR